MALNQFCGCFYMMNYAQSVFAESGSVLNLSPSLSVIVVGLIQLIGCYVCTLLVDRIGRKVCALPTRNSQHQAPNSGATELHLQMQSSLIILSFCETPKTGPDPATHLVRWVDTRTECLCVVLLRSGARVRSNVVQLAAFGLLLRNRFHWHSRRRNDAVRCAGGNHATKGMIYERLFNSIACFAVFKTTFDYFTDQRIRNHLMHGDELDVCIYCAEGIKGFWYFLVELVFNINFSAFSSSTFQHSVLFLACMGCCYSLQSVPSWACCLCCWQCRKLRVKPSMK